MSGDAATKVGFVVGADTGAAAGATATDPVPKGTGRSRRRTARADAPKPGGLGRTAAGPWVPRAAFVAFAVALLAFPRLVGTPTDARQWAEWLCYAMVAVGLDIAWGYGGMLALGQGLFFGLGAYAMAMHLSLDGASTQFGRQGQEVGIPQVHHGH